VKLFSVYLGGRMPPGRIGEDHEVVFVVAPDVPTARKQAKKKWSGSGRPHIDAVAALDEVDGYAVEVVPEGRGGDLIDVDGRYAP
jgi:hypothetical protein